MRMGSYLLYIERADTECSLSESGHYYFFSVNPLCLHVNQFIYHLYRTRIHYVFMRIGSYLMYNEREEPECSLSGSGPD